MEELRLRRCDLAACEAVCCHDGVYLGWGEEERIQALIKEDPAFFAFLPPEAVVDGQWEGRVEGRKTATRPFAYRTPPPAHFSATRCVFTLEDGRCSLQVLAVQRGLHPWSYKPQACWLHPLRPDEAGRLAPPPVDPAADPDRIGEHYPGFICYTPCGQHDPAGQPWRRVLAEELRYYQKTEVYIKE